MKHKPQKNKFNEGTKVKRFFDSALLKTRAEAEAPPSGVYYYKIKEEDLDKISKTESLKTEEGKKIPIQFDDLPISSYSKQGLRENKYEVMTDTQRCVIPHALVNRDILVCARTGSGKTLAFLIPLLEHLYREKWSDMDGLGALILVPTRELAMQVFEVLRIVGKYHTFSAGVIIGGNNSLDEEKSRISRLNIIVATPGRLLHHMNETPGFTVDSLKVLVLDEVDRILDLGFAEDMDQILEQIPRNTHIMLSSATLSMKIQRLVKVNLKKPEYISIHNYDKEKTEDNKENTIQTVTPTNLIQHYMVLEAKEKIDVVFSFLRTHTKNKIILFVSSCKQVRYMYEALRKLRPGISLYELHGRQKQTKRTEIFAQFADPNRKSAALFATDVASRGLDMPSVDWVVQIDCPEDTDSYIHRAGRTARYKSKGNSLLMLLPSETAFLKRLEQKGIQMKKISANTEKILTIQGTLQGLLSEHQELMKLAQKALISYVKSVHLMKDKEVFKLDKIDVKSLAKSMGLMTAPIIQFSQKSNEDSDSEKIPKKSKLDKLKEKIKQKKEQKQNPLNLEENAQSDDDELLKITRRIEPEISENEDEKNENENKGKIAGKRKVKIGKVNKLSKKIKFDENKGENEDLEQEEYIEKVKEKLQNQEDEIKETWKQRITKKRKEQREKKRKKELEKKLGSQIELLGDENEEKFEVRLGNPEENEEQEKVEIPKEEKMPKNKEELEEKVLQMLDID